MLKKVLSLLLALTMMASAMVFCAAETEIKVDVRLEVNNETREVDMVFSIPENANLSEFSFDIYYHFDTMSINSFVENSFENNLSPEEKEHFNFAVNTDALNRENVDINRPYCTVEGYANDNYALNKGGDIFTLKFTLAENLLDCNFGFTFDTEFILNGDREFYDEAIVPSTLSYFVQNQGIVDYYVTYSKFVTTTSLEQVNDQSKKAHNVFTGDVWTDFSGQQRWHPIANSPNASECTNIDSSSWSGGAWIPVQAFRTTSKYVRYLSTHIYISSVSAPTGQAYLTYRIRYNADAANNNILFSNNWAPSATNGWHTWDISGTTTIPTVPTGTTYYFQWAWTHPNYAGSGTQFIMAGKAYGTYMYYGGGLYEFGDHIWPFQVQYDKEAQAFENAVNAITTTAATNTADTQITTAANAYNALDNNNIKNNANISSLYSTFTSRQNTYNNNVKNAATAFINAVNNIGTSVTSNEIDSITSARKTYNALCTDARNYSGVAGALTKLEHQEAASPVVSAINNLGTITWSKRSDVESARTSYDALNSTRRGYVGNYSTLTTAEATIGNMKTAGNDFKALAAAIGTVDYDSASKEKIDAARAAYTTLEAFNDSTLTSTNWATEHLAILQAAETEYARLESEVTQFRESIKNIQPGDMDAVNALNSTYQGFTAGQQAAVYEDYTKLLAFSVLDLIDACFPVDLDKLDEIEAATNAYNDLSPELQALLGTNAEGLTYDVVLANALSEYNAMVKEVEDLVAAIGALDIDTLDFSDIAYLAELNNTYNEMTDLQKAEVTNYDVLVSAGEYIAELQLKVAEFKELVESIGEVDVDDLDIIVSAETMYAGFTDGQKAAVETEYQTLLNARNRIDVMIGEVEALDIQISTTIPETNVDVDSADAVNAANAIYNTFTDAQKGLLENEQILLDAIVAVAEAQAKVDAVETVIGNIGNVTYAKKAAVENARAEFEALTDAQKDAVSNVAILLSAEERIAEFEVEITAVEELINAIGTVDVDREDAINNAVNAYDDLSEAQKDAVENIDVLTTAQETLQNIKDMIDAFEAEIETLYPIDIDDGDVIIATEEKYDALTEPQKGAVENYNRLTEARATYDKMVADVATFKATMNDLGEVDLLDEDIEALNNSKALYESFTDLQKAEVEAEKAILDDAFVALDALWQEVYALMDAIDAIGEVTLEDEFAILDCIDIYENEFTAGQQSKVENLPTLLEAEEALNNLKVANSLYGVIVASNNVAPTQTVTLNLNSYNDVAGYYFGTSADYTQNEKVDTTATSDTKEITSAGTYYLNVFDVNGNISETASVTFVDVILNANGGEVGVTNIIVKQNNYIALPTATKDGDTFMGWARSENAVAGETVVDVENGGTFYAVWAGANKPALKVTSTNNVATKQTLIINATAGEDISGYYFGTSAYYKENNFTETNKKVSTVDVLDAGTYYVTVMDVSGNVSATIPVTFYKITLNANGGNVAIPFVIVKAGNSIDMPEAVNVGYQYLGWSTDVDETYANKTVTPTESATYFAIWTRELSVSATVGSVKGAKAGDRVYIPVSMDRYSNSFASIAINNVIFDKTVLSFVEFSIPENDFISHLSQSPVVNNARKTYKLINNPENAVDAYYTSAGVIVILVFDVLQDVNQFTSVSVVFDSENTAVFANGGADNWSETKSNVDVDVANGGVYANIDNEKPTALITSTNNISAVQTITLNMFDNAGVSGYYFGMNEEYANNQYFTDVVSVSKTISVAGTYYLTVVDIYGNVSDTVSATFYNIVLYTNIDSPAQLNILANGEGEVELPIYEKDGYTFKGWAENNEASNGEFIITATEDQVLYGIWMNSEEEIQNVIDLIDAIDEVVTLDSAEKIIAARLAYEALTDEQKVLVTNYAVLEVAEEVIANLSKEIGDVDQNGATDSIDALMILQACVGKIELTDEQLAIADVDQNGDVNVIDALYVLQISVGKITSVN
ncbi:MAG: InlB B-repeat-containing protein [Clostridia bacterium]|nr:InlB B-repeat-containing protein [Clostridia bacterium]